MSEPTVLLLARADGSRVTTSFTAASLGAFDPFKDGRQLAYNGPDGVSAGIVHISGTLDSDDFPHTEVIVVHAGHVVLQSETQTLELGVGASAVIGRGTALRLQAQADTCWAFCAVTSPTAQPDTRPDRARPAGHALAFGRTGTTDFDRADAAVPLTQCLRRRRHPPARRRLGFDTV